MSDPEKGSMRSNLTVNNDIFLIIDGGLYILAGIVKETKIHDVNEKLSCQLCAFNQKQL